MSTRNISIISPSVRSQNSCHASVTTAVIINDLSRANGHFSHVALLTRNCIMSSLLFDFIAC